MKNILFIFSIFLCHSLLYAHGDLSIRIKEKSKEISQNPQNSILFFERGYLYQQHDEYENAIKDFLKSGRLGFSEKIIYFRKAQCYYFNSDYNKALNNINVYIKADAVDIKGYKLRAQILNKLNNYSEALTNYQFVLNNTIDILPGDIIEYSKLILSLDPTNYQDALKNIEFGLDKLGPDVLTLQLAKLNYLKNTKNKEEAISQYNYFITTYDRKEFWYFKKANYLFEINKLSESNIALQQAKIAITQLKPKFYNNKSIKELINQINQLEKTLNHEN